MRKIVLSLLIIFNVGLSMANNNQPKIYYQMMFKVNDMFCRTELNGLYLMDTLDLPKSPLGPIPQSISMMPPIGDYLDESSNTLSLKVTNINEYIDNPENAYCEVIITVMVKNPQTGKTESKEVNNLRITYVKNEDSNASPYSLSGKQTDFSIDGKLASQEIKVRDLPSIFDANGLPAEKN